MNLSIFLVFTFALYIVLRTPPNEHDGDILYSINQDMILGCYYYTSVYNNNVIKHMLNTTKDNLDMFTGEDDFISCGVKELYDLIELNQLKICDEVIIRVVGVDFSSNVW